MSEEILERIAGALEQQVTFYRDWLEFQKKTHDEAEALTEKRYQEKREFEAMIIKREQEWHDEAERLNEQRYQENVARDQQDKGAWLDRVFPSNKEQS